MRGLKRSIAKTNMRALGFERMFKKKIVPIIASGGKTMGYDNALPFARNWRKYIVADTSRKKVKKRRRALAAK